MLASGTRWGGVERGKERMGKLVGFNKRYLSNSVRPNNCKPLIHETFSTQGNKKNSNPRPHD